jgi:hypothetical protein
VHVDRDRVDLVGVLEEILAADLVVALRRKVLKTPSLFCPCS